MNIIDTQPCFLCAQSAAHQKTNYGKWDAFLCPACGIYVISDQAIEKLKACPQSFIDALSEASKKLLPNDEHIFEITARNGELQAGKVLASNYSL